MKEEDRWRGHDRDQSGQQCVEVAIDASQVDHLGVIEQPTYFLQKL